MNIMKKIDNDWPPQLECRVCGAVIHATLHPSMDSLAWGPMQYCPRGCTREMLQGKLSAERRGREERLRRVNP